MLIFLIHTVSHSGIFDRKTGNRGSGIWDLDLDLAKRLQKTSVLHNRNSFIAAADLIERTILASMIAAVSKSEKDPSLCSGICYHLTAEW
jgi:hypothetical protein